MYYTYVLHYTFKGVAEDYTIELPFEKLNTQELIKKWSFDTGEYLSYDNFFTLPTTEDNILETNTDLIRPEYYSNKGMDLFDAFRNGILNTDEEIGFLKGNIMKYVRRCNKKHSTLESQLEDLNKAETYIQELKEFLQISYKP